MAFKRYLTVQERSTILSLKKKGISIFAMSRELHRSRAIITKFVRNPEEYIRNMKEKSKSSYDILENSSDNLLSDEQQSETNETPTKTPTKNGTTVKKIVRKNYESAKKKTFTEDDLKRFNRVTVEHRAVIKYLIKKGIGPRFIYEDIQKVYGTAAPDLAAILYWAKQYQQGRTTIFNESKATSTTITPNGKTKLTAKVTKTSPSKRIPDVKLFKFKFKPIKNL